MIFLKNVSDKAIEEKPPHTREELIQTICDMFNGRVLSPDEQRDHYKKIAFQLLQNNKIISKTILKEQVGYSCWNWFIREWGNFLQSVDHIHFKKDPARWKK